MDGYVNFTLAISPKGITAVPCILLQHFFLNLLTCQFVGSMIEPCYYRSFRDDDGNLTAFYWKLLVVRLAFVVIFEVVSAVLESF